MDEKQNRNELPPVLTTEQVAQLLGLSAFTIREYARAGKIPAKKVGKAWRFSRGALIRWLETPEEPDVSEFAKPEFLDKLWGR